MRMIALVLLLACSLSAQEKPYLLEYTVIVESQHTICGWHPCAVEETRYKRFESVKDALGFLQEPGGLYGLVGGSAVSKDNRTFVALYRTEKLNVEVATETTKQERVVVDEKHETVYRLDGKEYRKPKPETASGNLDGGCASTDPDDCAITFGGTVIAIDEGEWIVQ